MSKELSTVIGSTPILSQVDMKLTKQDVIDMVIEERKGQLQEEHDAATKAVDVILEAAETLRRNSEEELKKHVVAENKKLIKAFTEAYPKAKQIVSATVSVRFQDREYFDRDSQRLYNVGSERKPPELFRYQAHVQLTSDQSFSPKASLACHVKLPSAVLKAKEDESVKLYNLWTDATKLRNDLAKSNEDLNKRSGRVKAELTKKILEQTEQGKALLSAVNDLKKVVKL